MQMGACSDLLPQLLPSRYVLKMDDNGQLVVFHHGKVNDFSPFDFPPGSVYIEAIQAHGLDLPHHQLDPRYWQACARWALLKRFGLWNDKDCIGHAGKGRLSLSEEQIQAVTRQWAAATKQTKSQASRDGSCANDLLEFLETGTSNQRILEFASMRIAPGYELHCHAHPNLELAYCAQGTLHEIRVKEGHEPDKSLIQNADGSWQGPDASKISDGSWTVQSLHQGSWLVNPVGSIHKSFTDSSQGCLLVLLFGGSEANVQNEHIHAEQLEEAIQLVEKS